MPLQSSQKHAAQTDAKERDASNRSPGASNDHLSDPLSQDHLSALGQDLSGARELAVGDDRPEADVGNPERLGSLIGGFQGAADSDEHGNQIGAFDLKGGAGARMGNGQAQAALGAQFKVSGFSSTASVGDESGNQATGNFEAMSLSAGALVNSELDANNGTGTVEGKANAELNFYKAELLAQSQSVEFAGRRYHAEVTTDASVGVGASATGKVEVTENDMSMDMEMGASLLLGASAKVRFVVEKINPEESWTPDLVGLLERHPELIPTLEEYPSIAEGLVQYAGVVPMLLLYPDLASVLMSYPDIYGVLDEYPDLASILTSYSDMAAAVLEQPETITKLLSLPNLESMLPACPDVTSMDSITTWLGWS